VAPPFSQQAFARYRGVIWQKNNMLKLLKFSTFVAIGLTLYMSWYFFELLKRTEYLEYSISLAPDTMVLFHVFSLLLIVVLTLSTIKKVISVKAIGIFLAIAIILETSFLSFNINGKMWFHKKNSPKNLIEYIKGHNE
jgi:hypothetical protein